MNKELVNAIKTTKSVEELKDLAAKNGYVLTDEEAKDYFDMYHGSEKIKDNDLDNVAGGACNVGTGFNLVGGQTYSTEGHGWLITTPLNSCDGFKPKNIGDSKYCQNCSHVVVGNTQFVDGLIFYCSIRTKDDDPYSKSGTAHRV